MALQPQIDLLLGVAYYHADDPAKAIELLAPIVDRLPRRSLERREAEQVLGLAQSSPAASPRRSRARGDAAWARDNLELGYVLGQAYVQTQQPDTARGAFAGIFGVRARFGRRAPARRADDDPARDGASAEAELKRAVEKDPGCRRRNLLLGQIALFRGRLDEAVALTERELALNPGNAMALLAARRRLRAPGEVGRGDRGAAEVDLDQPVLQRALHPARPGLHEEGQPATAEGMLRRAIQYDPNNRSAHYLLAQLLQQAGRDEEAKREFAIAEQLQGQPGR